MKSIFRLISLALMLSGWIVAALCLHVIRTPNPADPSQSKLLVIPKERLGVSDTYVDARKWTMSDIPNHAKLIWRVLDSGKADQFKYLANPDSGDSVENQLKDALNGDRGAVTSRSATTKARYNHHRESSKSRLPQIDVAADGLDLSSLLETPISF